MSQSLPCRICSHSDSIEFIYSFGPQPVAGYLEDTVPAAREAPRLPLELMLCTRCGFLQQASDAAHRLLVERVYAQYQPTYSMSGKVNSYVEGFVNYTLKVAEVHPGDLVIEIGSNDGGMLALLDARKIRAVGIEPSDNLCSMARSRGLTVENTFFGAAAAAEIAQRHGKAKLILTRHTLEHVFDPLDFLRGISDLLSKDGYAVIEVPYVGLQMQNNQFQSMTFQHVSLFSLTSLNHALHKAGLTLVDARFVDMDAGSVVVFAIKGEFSPNGFIMDGLEYEQALEFDRPEGYASFFDGITRTFQVARTYLESLAARGLTVAGYGAGSKGQAILNMFKLDTPTIAFVIDDTPGNAGRFIPGTGIPVVASDDARSSHCEIVLVTAPTHVREIVSKESRRLGLRARFLATAPSFGYVTQTFA